jgi:hypothetical protein
MLLTSNPPGPVTVFIHVGFGNEGEASRLTSKNEAEAPELAGNREEPVIIKKSANFREQVLVESHQREIEPVSSLHQHHNGSLDYLRTRLMDEFLTTFTSDTGNSTDDDSELVSD